MGRERGRRRKRRKVKMGWNEKKRTWKIVSIKIVTSECRRLKGEISEGDG